MRQYAFTDLELEVRWGHGGAALLARLLPMQANVSVEMRFGISHYSDSNVGIKPANCKERRYDNNMIMVQSPASFAEEREGFCFSKLSSRDSKMLTSAVIFSLSTLPALIAANHSGFWKQNEIRFYFPQLHVKSAKVLIHPGYKIYFGIQENGHIFGRD